VHSLKVRVFHSDEDSVSCYHPPAYLLSNELAQNGGPVKVTIATNGIDFSEPTAATFTYLKKVQITQVHPPFILKDQDVTVTLTGLNFYVNSDTDLLRVRLTKVVTNPLFAEDSLLEPIVVSDTAYDSDSVVTFVFPSDHFADKDFVTIELTFDQITWDLADPLRLIVFEQIVLTKARPSYVYLDTPDV